MQVKKIIIALLAGSCWPALAQETTENKTEEPLFTAPLTTPAYNDSSVLSSSGATTDINDAAPINWGPIHVRPHFLYRISYGDGIQSTPGRSVKTVVQQISPGALFELGDYWRLDYTPTFNIYSNKELKDTLNHQVVLKGETTFENWRLGFSHAYEKTSEPLVETGTQTDQETHVTLLSASYRFSSALWTDLSLRQNIRLAEGFSSSREWVTLDWLNVQVNPVLFTGIGVGFGYVNLERGSDMTYEQLLGQVGWRPTEKIQFRLNGGAEFRQFVDSDADDLINPLVGAEIEYQPFEHTKLSVSARRNVTTSFFDDTVTETTEYRISLDQRLLGKLNLNLAYGYGTSDYVTTTPVGGVSRDDKRTIYSARLTCPIRKRATVSLFYYLSENSSSQSRFSYDSSQIGLELGYRY